MRAGKWQGRLSRRWEKAGGARFVQREESDAAACLSLPVSLADAEAGEDAPQQVVAAEGAGDLTQGLLGHAQVFGEEFACAHQGQLVAAVIEVLFSLVQGFEVESYCRVVAEDKITAVFLVPTLIYALIDAAEVRGRHDLSSLDMIVYGAAPMSPDRLPIVGALPNPAAIQGQPRLPALPRHPGLWCVQGFGARGIVWSALMANLLLSRLEGDPLPLENDLVDAVDPGRFLLKSRGRPQDEDAFDDRT